MNALDRYAAQWLSWMPGQSMDRDPSGLAEALRDVLGIEGPVTVGLLDGDRDVIPATWNARASGPSYWTALEIPVSDEDARAGNMWARARLSARPVWDGTGSQWLLRVAASDRVMGVIAVEGRELSPSLGRRLAVLAPRLALGLLALQQAQRRELEHRWATAAAQAAATYALSERLDDQSLMNGMAAAMRKALQVDRCVLVEYTRPDAAEARHFAAGVRHLWHGSDRPPIGTVAGFAERLAGGRAGHTAGGLVAWIPLAEVPTHGLTLLVDNLISEGPLPAVEDPVWDAIRHVVGGFWRLWRGFEAVRRRAERDDLTGLYNRAGGLPFLRDWVARANAWAVPVTIVFLDLDHFKTLNDQFGHEAGDRVLRAVGRWLSQHLRPTDVAVRYGGDEFVVLLPEVSAAFQPQAVDRLVAGLQSLRPVAEAPPVSVSAGAVVGPDRGEDLEGLLRRADQALYHSKAVGGHQWTLARGGPQDRQSLVL